MSRHEYYRNRKFDHRPHNPKHKAIFGIGVIIVGVLLMLKTFGYLHFNYMTAWPVLLIIFGVLVGLKSAFRHPGSWVLIIIGIANLVPEFTVFGHPSEDLLWPAMVILGGVFILFRSFCKPSFARKEFKMDTVTTSENNINIDVTFAGRKEFITSKDFKGGSISATFGGCEVNLMQADTTEKLMVIDMKISFGGVELIVPSNWEIQNEISTSFGSVEDERMMQPQPSGNEQKVLLLKGTCSFGNVEIKSF